MTAPFTASNGWTVFAEALPTQNLLTVADDAGDIQSTFFMGPLTLTALVEYAATIGITAAEPKPRDVSMDDLEHAVKRANGSILKAQDNSPYIAGVSMNELCAQLAILAAPSEEKRA